jgi:tellurite resistance protein
LKRLTISGKACTETLSLLIAMAWADGRLDDSEAQGVRGATEVLNLTKEQRDRVETMLATPAPLSQIGVSLLGARDQAFAYVAAAWLAHVDNKLDPKEEEMLGELGAKLGFSPERQKELVTIAKGLEGLPAGARNWGQEITKLFKAIPPELEELDAQDLVEGEEFEVVFGG